MIQEVKPLMKYQVLIVDDEEIVCRGLSQFVKWSEHGFEVAGIAHSADDALMLVEKLSIHVVFMDIRMPGKSGLELLKILRLEAPAVKCIILSGFADFSYAQEAMRYGALDYLTKPVNLGEVEALLDRMRQEFEVQRQEIEIHNQRLEALLLSAAKGYASADQSQYNFPALGRWYGLSMSLLNRELSETEITAKKEKMSRQISSILPAAIVLNDDIFQLFCILPCESDAEFDSFLSILEQLCSDFPAWGFGASKPKNGLSEIHTSYEEAARALRYRRAGGKERIILYQNIEALFSQSVPSVPDALSSLLCLLTNPDTRKDSTEQLTEILNTLLTQNLTLTQYQTVCIRFLIELNSYLQERNFPETDLHSRLNDTLGRLLLCSDYPDSSACMIDYMEWLTTLLDRFDEQQLGKGTIREICLYIRQHYNENITLNGLAERFFLHPNYLSRLFKEKTGKNFIEYLTEVRMERVKELLKSSDLKIVEICAMTGYDNPRYFSKVFKQATGMTPREYREHAEP